MTRTDHARGLVPALLKQWRAQRGLSQLDLALAADVSARHISFLETGRSVPSPEMVCLLGDTLGVPRREVNTMLVAAGHEPLYDGDRDGDELPGQVRRAVDLLKAHHEPFPLVVLDRTYTVVDANQGAVTVLAAVLGLEPAPTVDDLVAARVNLARLTFDPAGAQPYLVDFEEVGRQLLWRIQREVLAAPDDDDLRALLDDLLAQPTIGDGWRHVDLSVPSEPALVLHLRRGDLDLRFLSTVTSFQVPQNVAVEQLRIEHWLPYDDATAAACRTLDL